MINFFISYSHKDTTFREELEKHLIMLRRNNLINTWHDRKITAGQEWNNEILNELKTADIILLLISSDFLSSNYCYDIEIKKAIERHENKEAIVIPIIVRFCDWQDTPFSKLQALPSDGKPIKEFDDIDKAYLNIITNLKKVINDYKTLKNEIHFFDGETKKEIVNPKIIEQNENLEIHTEIANFKQLLIDKFSNRTGFFQTEESLKRDNENRELLFYKCKTLKIDVNIIEKWVDELIEVVLDVESFFSLNFWKQTDYYPDQMFAVSTFLHYILLLRSKDWFDFHFSTSISRTTIIDTLNKSEKCKVWMRNHFHSKEYLQ